MSSEELYDRLKRNFRPTRIFTCDGKIHDVRHRLLTVVTDDYVDIGVQAEDRGPGVADHAEIYLINEIVRVEDLGDAEGSHIVEGCRR